MYVYVIIIFGGTLPSFAVAAADADGRAVSGTSTARDDGDAGGGGGDDGDAGGRADTLGGHERRRLLAVGCGSLAAGATLVALITLATDRCHVCSVRRRRRRSFLSNQSRRRARPEPEVVAATPPSLSTELPTDHNRV